MNGLLFQLKRSDFNFFLQTIFELDLQSLKFILLLESEYFSLLFVLFEVGYSPLFLFLLFLDLYFIFQLLRFAVPGKFQQLQSKAEQLGEKIKNLAFLLIAVPADCLYVC